MPSQNRRARTPQNSGPEAIRFDPLRGLGSPSLDEDLSGPFVLRILRRVARDARPGDGGVDHVVEIEGREEESVTTALTGPFQWLGGTKDRVLDCLNWMVPHDGMDVETGKALRLASLLAQQKQFATLQVSILFFAIFWILFFKFFLESIGPDVALSLEYLMGCCHLAAGRLNDAKNAFLAASVLFESENYVSIDEQCFCEEVVLTKLESVDLKLLLGEDVILQVGLDIANTPLATGLRYHLHVMRLFEAANEPTNCIIFARAALSCLDRSEAAVGGPALGEGEHEGGLTLHARLRGVILSNILKFSLELHDWDRAFAALVDIPHPDFRSDCLRRFVTAGALFVCFCGFVGFFVAFFCVFEFFCRWILFYGLLWGFGFCLCWWRLFNRCISVR
jgi:hypothetical protein